MKNTGSPYELQCKNYKKDQDKQRQSLKQQAKLVINVSDTQYAVVKLIAKKMKWLQSTDPMSSMSFDLCWTDAHVKQQMFYKMNQFQRINHFPGMEILSRKNNLGKSLMAFRQRFPEDFQFFPNTWMLPAEWSELKDYHDNRKSGKAQTFIVKPQAACQGRGIFLTRQIDRLKNQRCVVQRYLHKPFLIDGLKFDLRIYVLLAGTDPLRIFVYEQGLARFATQPYVPPRSDNLENRFMHLTNYAINKNSPNFIFNEAVQECDKGHKRSLTSVMKAIGEMGHNVQQLQARIDDIIIKTIITGYPTLSRVQQTVHPQNYANNICFQILGFDVMLDQNLNPVLLQINYTSSFTTDTPLDKHIKKNLISDTLSLLGINDEWKSTIKKKKDIAFKERMVSGRKQKLTLQEKIEAIQTSAAQRNEYQSQNLGAFRKIFVKSNQQFQEYRKYYDFAEQLYVDQNRLYSPGIGTNTYYHLPFMKESRRKQRRESSLYNSGANLKKDTLRSIQSKRPYTAKSSKKVVISSSKNLKEEKNRQQAQEIYFGDNPFFENSKLKVALKTNKKKKQQAKQTKETKDDRKQ